MKKISDGINPKFFPRTITLGIDLLELDTRSAKHLKSSLSAYTTSHFDRLNRNLEKTYRSKSTRTSADEPTYRIAVTPLDELHLSSKDACIDLGCALDDYAESVGAEFVGGYGAFAERGLSRTVLNVIESIPEALHETKRLCGFVNVGTSDAGLNMNAVVNSARALNSIGRTDNNKSIEACARFTVSANAQPNVPYMPLGHCGSSAGHLGITVGVNGLDEIIKFVSQRAKDCRIEEIFSLVSECTRLLAQQAELEGMRIAENIGAKLIGIDVSLLPQPLGSNHSLVTLLKELGVESLDSPGSLSVIALLTDAIRRGGMAGSPFVSGLSGLLISISEDSILGPKPPSLDRLLAMTSACSIGLDMIAVPRTTSIEVLSGIIADTAIIGNIHRKITSTRLLLAGETGSEVLMQSNNSFGATIVIDPGNTNSEGWINRSGFAPPSLRGRNI